MNIVIDTNVAVSGLLWGGPPNQILKWARDKRIRVPACKKTIDEFERVIRYPKFSSRLSALEIDPQRVLSYFHDLITYMPIPDSIPAIIEADPFDDLFLALALASHARLIISGDKHLLDLKTYQNIQIVTPSEGVAVILRLKEKLKR
ncbi:MAG: putative toxin-antitoxin system toxin component, PIN family [Deltaproteobacteria bacterium]|nr:putative toxin-antitoxin system toxin component, PIN family [Deltaproteobacteria bacterium]